MIRTDVCGIILLNKRPGITSAKAVAELKSALSLSGVRTGKLGHAGTLDPMADGLLVCCLGSATRLIKYCQSGKKIYTGIIEIGRKTDTDDVTGETIERRTDVPEAEHIMRAIRSLEGEIAQKPPAYSAVKVNGERSYKLAREGRCPELGEKRVRVHRFTARKMEGMRLHFEIECSGGTYIRSLARDLGEILGVGGCLAALRREYSYPFSVKEARESGSVDEQAILNWGLLFPDACEIETEAHEAKLLLSGHPAAIKSFRDRRLCDFGSDAAIYKLKGDDRPLGLFMKGVDGWELVFNVGFSVQNPPLSGQYEDGKGAENFERRFSN